jgi:selenocysteine-specific elongation factor
VAVEVPAKDSSRHFRLPVDRAFVMKGFGVVITGTLISGRIQKDAEVEAHPIGKRLRVRGIQVHGRAVDAACAGQRTALNLSGAETGELLRGMSLTEPGRFASTRRVDCLLHMLPSAPALKNGAQVHFHAGTAEVIATAVCLEGRGDNRMERKVEPGERAYVQFRLRDPVLLLPGDRFIIRKLSPLITIGGGRILDNWVPAETIPARLGRSEESIARLRVLERGNREEILLALVSGSPARCLGMEELIARTGWLEQECRHAVQTLQKSGQLIVLSENPLRVAEAAHLRGLSEAVLVSLAKFHQANPLLPGASVEAIRAKVLTRAHPLVASEVLRQLTDQKKVTLSGETIRLASHKIVLKEEEERAKQQIARAFEKAELTVPSVKEVLGKLPVEPKRSEKILQILIQEGTLVRVSEDLVFHAEALRRLRRLLSQYKTQSERISVSAFKDLVQVSRKYAIPLLEYLDRERVTRRAGDERILL